jgi:hypothetical protein
MGALFDFMEESMAKQPRASTRSTNPKTAENNFPKQKAGDKSPARAHRGDTPEGRAQREGVAKTHPTSRRAGAARKDKPVTRG